MLRIIQNSSAAGVKSYYSTADYYLEGQELGGIWKGKAAEMLGLSGNVQKEDWDALCDNIRPGTSDPLTQRQRLDRRVSYDFNFHCPKSLSLLYGLTQDERLLDAFRDSVDATMRDMEAEMQTRLRKHGQNEDRITGNMVWGEFVHFTARPVGEIPDPHLHMHCVVFNASFEKEEGVWKAGQFGSIKRDASYFEAKFHSRLAQKMGELGLPVARSKKGWELAGITKETVDKFSRRTAIIEEEAKRLGITDPDAKSQLGAKTRKQKEKHLTLPELVEEWKERLTPEESDQLKQIRSSIGSPAIPLQHDVARQSLDRAIGHVFERKSVAPGREVLAHALRSSVGSSSIEAVEHAAAASPDLIRAMRDGRQMVTTPEVIAEEQKMVAYARRGRGTQPRLGKQQQAISREWLNEDQKAAVRHVWASRDTVTLVRGAAGVGKTTMLQETVEGIRENGGSVFAMAPSAGARDVLRTEGFETAETLARWLEDKKLQKETRGSVLWVDEAGLVSSKDMARLFDSARKHGNRIIMSGDRRQHGSVARGAALRMLEQDAGLVPAEIREIQRQKGAYKEVVQSLADGETREGFEKLAAMGWIREVGSMERYQTMAEDYVQSVASGADTLVVSPTHFEGERIEQAIREKLKDRKLLRDDARSFATLQNANLTQAERQDMVNYQPGDVVVFHQNAKGHGKGEQLEVGQQPVPVDLAARFQLFHRTSMQLATGDMIRISRNGKSLEGKRLTNGDLHRVAGFDKQGNIRLVGGRTMASDYQHFTYGYCVTSHAAQGKSVDRVLIGQSSASFPASSREQFYVSVSRARKQAVIYTDSMPDLLHAVEQSETRLTASDLFDENEWREKGQMIQRQQLMAMQEQTLDSQNRDVQYER